MPQVTVRPTPNPNSLKFTVEGVALVPGGLYSFRSAREAEGHPLGAALFTLDGVLDVLLVPDFVTVTKHPAADWNRLAESVERLLLDHFADAGADAEAE